MIQNEISKSMILMKGRRYEAKNYYAVMRNSIME